MTPLDMLSRLPKGFGLSIYTGDQFGQTGRWKANLEYTGDEGENFRFTAIAPTLPEALEALWSRANAPIAHMLGAEFYIAPAAEPPEGSYVRDLTPEDA